MSKKMKMHVETKAPPKRSVNFKDMNVREMLITYRQDTERFVLSDKNGFMMSDINLDHVVRYAELVKY